MKPELKNFLEKARQCLANGKANLSIGLSNDAGRNAYLAAYHTAQAYIFVNKNKIAKTHQGVQSLFSQLAKDDPRIPPDLHRFLTQAYDLKAVADYETGTDSVIPLSRSQAALIMAENFITILTAIIDQLGKGNDTSDEGDGGNGQDADSETIQE